MNYVKFLSIDNNNTSELFERKQIQFTLVIFSYFEKGVPSAAVGKVFPGNFSRSNLVHV